MIPLISKGSKVRTSINSISTPNSAKALAIANELLGVKAVLERTVQQAARQADIVKAQQDLLAVERRMMAEGQKSLLDVLRRGLGDLSPKYGCGQGTCGACTVLNPAEATVCYLCQTTFP